MIIRLVILTMFLPFTGMILAQTRAVPVSIAFEVGEKDLIPEGITYDGGTHQFFISSINKEKVLAINEKGIAADFIKSGQYGLLQTLGMKVDMPGRRLWVVSNKLINGKHISAVHVFNIDNKALVKKFILEKDTTLLFNDLVLTNNGGAYITDTYSGTIYAVTPDMGKLEPFISSDSLLQWSNGLTISPDNQFLYVATGGYITLINLVTKAMEVMKKPESVSTSGIDGLVFYKASLIGIVNSRDEEKDMFIVRYQLGSDLREISEMSIIDKGNPLFNLPTTCVMADDSLYCLANTSLRVFFNRGIDWEKKLHNPIILKYTFGN